MPFRRYWLIDSLENKTTDITLEYHYSPGRKIRRTTAEEARVATATLAVAGASTASSR